MGKFTDEIVSLKEQERLLKHLDQDLRSRIMSVVRTEIIPRLQHNYHSVDFKIYHAFLSESELGLCLGFEIPFNEESNYHKINVDLKNIYQTIEEEYGIEVVGFRSIMRFSS